MTWRVWSWRTAARVSARKIRPGASRVRSLEGVRSGGRTRHGPVDRPPDHVRARRLGSRDEPAGKGSDLHRRAAVRATDGARLETGHRGRTGSWPLITRSCAARNFISRMPSTSNVCSSRVLGIETRSPATRTTVLIASRSRGLQGAWASAASAPARSPAPASPRCQRALRSGDLVPHARNPERER